MSNTESTRQAIDAYFTALGQVEREAFVALFDPDVHFEDPLGTAVLTGHEGVARFHKGLARAWSSLMLTPTAVHVRGNHAAAAWHATGVSSTGRTITFDGINTFEVGDNGLVRRLEGYWDFESVIAQM